MERGMRKLVLFGLAISVCAVAFAGSQGVAGVTGSSASSTFGVGVPQNAKSTAAAKAKAADKKVVLPAKKAVDKK